MTRSPRTPGVEWINAADRGANGNNVANNSDLLNALLAELPEGGTLYLPPGRYRLRSTVFIPRGRTLRGADNSRWHYQYGAKTVLVPEKNGTQPYFNGDAVVKMADESISPDGIAADGAGLRNITIDGGALPWTTGVAGEVVHGVYCEGLVRNIRMEQVTVNSARGNAFRFAQGASTVTGSKVPRGIEARRLRSVNSCRLEHYYLSGTCDSTFDDVLAASGQSDGFVLHNLGETKIIGARAVFTPGVGFRITGTPIPGNQGYGGWQLLGPSTDRNAKQGILITSTSPAPLTISAPLLRRDGGSATAEADYPALEIAGSAGAKACPVFVSGLAMVVGNNDSGTGPITPLTGVRVVNGSLTEVSGMAHGVTTAVVDAGGHTVAPVLPRFRRTGSSTYTDTVA